MHSVILPSKKQRKATPCQTRQQRGDFMDNKNMNEEQKNEIFYIYREYLYIAIVCLILAVSFLLFLTNRSI